MNIAIVVWLCAGGVIFGYACGWHAQQSLRDRAEERERASRQSERYSGAMKEGDTVEIAKPCPGWEVGDRVVICKIFGWAPYLTAYIESKDSPPRTLNGISLGMLRLPLPKEVDRAPEQRDNTSSTNGDHRPNSPL